jgi:hypothetical protein
MCSPVAVKSEELGKMPGGAKKQVRKRGKGSGTHCGARKGQGADKDGREWWIVDGRVTVVQWRQRMCAWHESRVKKMVLTGA